MKSTLAKVKSLLQAIVIMFMGLNVCLICPAWAARANLNSCPTLQEDQLSFTQLKNIIQNPNCNVRSISDVLEILPESFRSNYSMFYRSRSLQGPHKDDFLNPRALVFGNLPKSNLVISFNGRASQPGHNGLEILEINTKGGADDLNIFRYFDIEFPFAEAEIGDKSWAEVQNKILFSTANPPRCTACHGQPARPIFPGYPDWEGSFASIHAGPLPVGELDGINKYLAKVSSTEVSRYQKLIKNTIFSPEYFFFNQTNSALNHYLGDANAIRVARLVKQTPQYEQYRYAFAGAFMSCENFPQLLPALLLNDLHVNLETRSGLKAKWTMPNIDQFMRTIYDYTRLFVISDWVYNGAGVAYNKVPYATFVNLVNKAANNSPDYLRLQLDTIKTQGISRGDPMATGLRLIMEGRGLDISNWFIDLTQPTYRFHNGGNARAETVKELVKIDSGFDHEMGNLLIQDPDYRSQEEKEEAMARICSQLQNLSQSSLGGVRAVVLAPLPADHSQSGYPNTFVNTCSKCHDSDLKIAPAIPFNSPAMMSRWLLTGDNKAHLQEKILSPDEKRRMPPTRILKEQEVSAILKYLNGI